MNHSLCGEKGFIFWDGDIHSFGECFQKLVLGSGSFSLLSILSVYYIGLQSPTIQRSRIQKITINFRISITFFLFLAAILHPFLLILYVNLEILWDDIAVFITQILGWFCHFVFLLYLKKKFSRSSRGPSLMLLIWTPTFIFQILFCKNAWNKPTHGNDGLIATQLLQGILTFQLVFQVFYLISLFPKGEILNLYDDGQVDQTTSTSTSQQRRQNIRRVFNAFDLQNLGEAETNCNKLSYFTFYWVNQLMKKGYDGQLESVDDLYTLPDYLQTETVSSTVQKTMMLSQPLTISDEDSDLQTISLHPPIDPKRKKSKYSLFKALHKCYGVRFYAIGILRLIADSLAFVGPMLLHELILFVENKSSETYKGYGAGIGICLASLIGCLCTIHFNYCIVKINLQIRAALISSIFRKIQQVNNACMNMFSTGEIVTLMSTDTERVVNFCSSFHSCWSLPLQLGVTLYLLYRQIGFAFVAGVVFVVILIPINRCIAVKIAQLSKRMMHFKDRRVHLMSEALEMIKAIKLNAWEDIFKQKIMDERYGEVNALAGRKYLDAICVFLWAATPILIPIFAFGTFASFGYEMEPAKIFTAVALFNMLISPLNAFPWVINGLVEAWISFKRIQKLMECKNHDMNEYYTVVPEISKQDADLEIVILNGNFSWTFEDEREIENIDLDAIEEETEGETSITVEEPVQEEDTSNLIREESGETFSEVQENLPIKRKFLLKDLSLHIPKGKFIGVVGSVGSGKTCLLNAIIGELEKVSGVISVAGLYQGFGYASQKPWLLNKSIKDNIVFGQNFDPIKYKKVLHVCSLEEDLQVLSKGENTNCGENGAKLSGGQKARVALARTIYQNKSIYLLDDILSAVDPSVANEILNLCIFDFLSGKTRVVVSHHLHYLIKADHIIQMDKGRVIRQGPPSVIFPYLGVDKSTIDKWIKKTISSRISPSTGTIPRHRNSFKEDPMRIKYKVSENTPEDTEEEEARAYGGLSGDVFSTYGRAIGFPLVLCILCSLLLMQISKNLTDTWLAKWVSHTSPSNESLSSHDNNIWFTNIFDQLFQYEQNYEIMPSTGGMDRNTKYYLTIYGLLAICNTIFTLARAFLFAYGGICAAKKLHVMLLDSVLNAKIGFFDMNPVGRILNRFSTDTYTADDSLPFQANIFFSQVLGLLGSICVTIYSIPWIVLLYIPLMFVYYNVQDFYRHTSRELRRIYALSLSPLYNHFVETLNGLPVIKALRAGHKFGVIGDAYLEQNQRAQYSMDLVSQWLNLRLQLIGTGILTGVVVLVLWEHHLSGINAGLVGLIISYALSINGFLNGVVSSLTDTERELISVERLNQYIKGAFRETEDHTPILALPSMWPQTPTIQMENVSLRYHAHNPYSLRNINLNIKANEKIGIVGRTGAGKSSLFMALFRLVPLSRGSITIDDVDITDISIRKLRKTLAIVSQDVLLFSGTVRENLDPRNQNEDEEVVRVLQKCHLSGVLEDLGGLNASLSAGGKNLSAGQRQLFCLARALLSKTKIVCIDEGTSSLDYETDLKVQNVMRNAFRNKTVLVIAHRIHTIRDCDHIIILKEGEMIESGRPTDLIQTSDGNFTFGHATSSSDDSH